MKHILSYIFIVLSIMIVNAQQEEANAFQQSENQATGTTTGSTAGAAAENQVQSGPGNPPGDEEIPIDDYLPILAIIGASLIIYQCKSKKIKTHTNT